jgi:NADPH2:quinone reductase
MRAVAFCEFGGPDRLHLIDLPPQPLGRQDVRLRVRAVAVNPTDTMYRAGAWAEIFPDEVPPYIAGMDAAGEVIEVGDDVDHVSVGDTVMAVVMPHGAYREDLVVRGSAVVPVPAGADPVAASTLPMNGLTARRALNLMGLKAGEVLAVTGSAGAFGGYVIPLAKAEGLHVIADAAEKDRDLVRSFGADIVVPRGDEVAAHIRSHFPGGVDGLTDGSLQGDVVLPAVKDGGVVVTVRGQRGDGRRGLRVHPVVVDDMAGDRDALDALRQQVEDGLLTLRVARTFRAEEAAEAHRMLERGGVRGRIVLTF